MKSSITATRGLLLALAACTLALSLSRPALAARPKLAPWARPSTGPLFLCRPVPPPTRLETLVVWTQGQQLIVAAAREGDPLPGWLGAGSAREWRMPLQDGMGAVSVAGHHTLVIAEHVLDCTSTRED